MISCSNYLLCGQSLELDENGKKERKIRKQYLKFEIDFTRWLLQKEVVNVIFCGKKNYIAYLSVYYTSHAAKIENSEANRIMLKNCTFSLTHSICIRNRRRCTLRKMHFF